VAATLREVPRINLAYILAVYDVLLPTLCRYTWCPLNPKPKP
jgi:hypothetical protein